MGDYFALFVQIRIYVGTMLTRETLKKRLMREAV
jgi:hypothetical protein